MSLRLLADRPPQGAVVEVDFDGRRFVLVDCAGPVADASDGRRLSGYAWAEGASSVRWTGAALLAQDRVERGVDMGGRFV